VQSGEEIRLPSLRSRKASRLHLFGFTTNTIRQTITGYWREAREAFLRKIGFGLLSEANCESDPRGA
jgi:hypothetical protein